MPAGERCTLDDYLGGDNDLPVCTDLDSDSWEVNFMSELGLEEECNEDEEEEEMDDEPPTPLKVQSFKEAIDSIENF